MGEKGLFELALGISAPLVKPVFQFRHDHRGPNIKRRVSGLGEMAMLNNARNSHKGVDGIAEAAKPIVRVTANPVDVHNAIGSRQSQPREKAGNSPGVEVLVMNVRVGMFGIGACQILSNLLGGCRTRGGGGGGAMSGVFYRKVCSFVPSEANMTKI